jgi:hypothetical protein
MNLKKMNEIKNEKIKDAVIGRIRSEWHGNISNDIDFYFEELGGINYCWDCGIAWENESPFLKDDYRTYKLHIDLIVDDKDDDLVIIKMHIFGKNKANDVSFEYDLNNLI